jgi:hypothetical protein
MIEFSEAEDAGGAEIIKLRLRRAREDVGFGLVGDCVYVTVRRFRRGPGDGVWNSKEESMVIIDDREERGMLCCGLWRGGVT